MFDFFISFAFCRRDQTPGTPKFWGFSYGESGRNPHLKASLEEAIGTISKGKDEVLIEYYISLMYTLL